MDPKWIQIALQLSKYFQGGTSTDDIRSVIQEEMKRSQNHENNETMRQVLVMIEKKHEAELHEASRERDMFKTQAELLMKQVQELQRSKEAEDKNERLNEFLREFAQLKINQQPNQSTNYRNGYQKKPYTQKYPQRGKQNSNASTLPWMDSPKSNPNTKVGENSDQPFNQEKKIQYHKNFNYSGNKHGENLDKPFNQEKKDQYEKNFNYSDTKFAGNPDKSFNQEKKGHYHKKNFQHGHQSQHDMPSRGHQSKRGAGRDQRDNNRGRGRGRSASVGRNTYESQVGNPATLNNDTNQSTSFHVQVTKTVGNQWQWLSSEKLSNASHSANYGRGQQGGFARGGQQRGSGVTRERGRGRGNSNFQSQGNQYPTGNKNRKKKSNEEEGDPADNCTLS